MDKCVYNIFYKNLFNQLLLECTVCNFFKNLIYQE